MFTSAHGGPDILKWLEVIFHIGILTLLLVLVIALLIILYSFRAHMRKADAYLEIIKQWSFLANRGLEERSTRIEHRIDENSAGTQKLVVDKVEEVKREIQTRVGGHNHN